LKILRTKVTKIFSLSIAILFAANIFSFALDFCSINISGSCCRNKCGMDSFKMESLKFSKNCSNCVKSCTGFKAEATIDYIVLSSKFYCSANVFMESDVKNPDLSGNILFQNIALQKLIPDRCIRDCNLRI
jgi:hypothetical protein